jgi:hypothetical protein
LLGSKVGNVGVEVQVAADGLAKKAHVVGGHPVLALKAEKTALLMEFGPGPRESTQIIEYHSSLSGLAKVDYSGLTAILILRAGVASLGQNAI